MMQGQNMHYAGIRRFPLGKALLFLGLFFVAGLFLTTFLSGLLTVAFPGLDKVVNLKLTVVLQNILAFMLPAFLMALVVGKPIRFLQLDKKPSAFAVIGVIVLYVVMTPAMNMIVSLNESIKLPESMAALEQWMKSSEEAALAVTSQLVDVSSIPAMLLSVLYIGLLTGLGEESFFRGALQNVFCKGTGREHFAVWTAAVIFSLLHFQFYGFVPRVLLGAFLGYAFLWSGSLWVPVIGHALNNSVVVVNTYLMKNHIMETDLSTVGTDLNAFPWLAVLSLVLTVVLMMLYREILMRKRYK